VDICLEEIHVTDTILSRFLSCCNGSLIARTGQTPSNRQFPSLTEIGHPMENLKMTGSSCVHMKTAKHSETRCKDDTAEVKIIK
jgi:hypothetical protein